MVPGGRGRQGARPARGDGARGAAWVRRSRRRRVGRGLRAGLGPRRIRGRVRGHDRTGRPPPTPNVTTHLYQVAVAGGEPKALTSGGDGQLRGPALRAGRPVAVLPRERREGQDLRPRPARLRGLALDGRGHAAHRVASTAPSPTSRSRPDGRVFLTAEDAGIVKLYSVPAKGGDVTPVTDVRGAYGSIEVAETAKPTVLVASWGNAIRPAEIVRIDPVAKKQTRAHELHHGGGGQAGLAAPAGVLVHERQGQVACTASSCCRPDSIPRRSTRSSS